MGPIGNTVARSFSRELELLGASQAAAHTPCHCGELQQTWCLNRHPAPSRLQRSDSAGRASAAASRGAPAAANGAAGAAANGNARSGASSRDPTPLAADRGAGGGQNRQRVEGAGTGFVMIDDDVFPSRQAAAAARDSNGLVRTRSFFCSIL